MMYSPGADRRVAGRQPGEEKQGPETPRLSEIGLAHVFVPAQFLSRSEATMRPQAERSRAGLWRSQRTFCSTRKTAVASTADVADDAEVLETGAGERPREGSSMMRSFGSFMRPRPMETMACSPPDMVPRQVRRSFRRGKRSYTRARRSLMRFLSRS